MVEFKYVLLFVLSILTFLYTVFQSMVNKFIFLSLKDRSVDTQKIKNYFYHLNLSVDVHHYYVHTRDNIKISCIKLLRDTKNIFIFSHGNAGTINSFLYGENISILLKYGSIILYDYRGYGLSKGEPSQDGIYYDLNAVWNDAIKEYPQSDISLYGFSIGCYPSIRLYHSLQNNSVKPKYVILQGPFVSVDFIVQKKFCCWLSYLIQDKYNNKKYMGEIKKEHQKNIFIIHSKDDDIIEYEHALELQKMGEYQLVNIQGTHNGVVYGDQYKQFIDNLFLDK